MGKQYKSTDVRADTLRNQCYFQPTKLSCVTSKSAVCMCVCVCMNTRVCTHMLELKARQETGQQREGSPENVTSA